jgi:hypothetical protein
MSSTELDQEVRAKLFQLMTGLIGLRDFQAWFAPVAWRLGDAARGEHPISRRVELRLAEYTNGDWTEAQVRELLGRMLRPDHVPQTTAFGFGNPQGAIHDSALSLWNAPVTGGAK